MKTISYRSLVVILSILPCIANFQTVGQRFVSKSGKLLFTPATNGCVAVLTQHTGTADSVNSKALNVNNGVNTTYISQTAGAATTSGLLSTSFTCSPGIVWQVTGSPNSKLSSYNVNTGLTTVVASLSYEVNAIGYNETDGMIWGSNVNSAGNILRIDATGTVTSFTISHLPSSNYYDVGVELPGGFLLLAGDDLTTYYVVDINPSDANYLKLVNPANTSVAQSGTYGKTMSAVLNCNDISYDPVNGLLYGIGSPGTTDAYKLISLNPTTGTVTKSTSKVTGSTIQSETLGYGSAYFDPSGILYVFADLQGYFYSVNVSTFTASLISKSTAAQNNDGANCPGAFLSYLISGTVYDDANGLNDNTVNGSGTNVGGTLSAVLYDNTAGIVASVATVASDGTFSLPATPGDSYTVYLLSGTVPTVGTTSTPTPVLPSGWVNTGEYLGSGAGSDGTVNGILTIGAVNAATTNANFGIDSKPTGTNTTAASQPNPNGGGAATVPSTVFNGTDAEDGTYSGNLTGRTVILNAATGGTLYYNGAAVTSSTTISSFDPAKVALDPTSTGATSPTFTYEVQDNASVFSSNITVTVPFTTPSRAISGTIWDDANGDALKGSTESYTNAGGSLYVNLVSTAGVVIQSVLADATTGAYSLGGATNTAYKIIITNTAQATGGTLTASTIPSGWVATGVNISGTASTANQTGIISVVSGTSALTNQNFGIEQTPTSNNVSATYNNPGGTITVTAPTLQGSDPEDQSGTGSLSGKIVKIQSLPSSGTLYYNGAPVTAGQTINNYSPSLLTFDPPNGTGAYSFNYSYVDNAGQISPVATASITIQCASISVSASAGEAVFCASSSPFNLTSMPTGGVTPYASFSWTGSGLTSNNTQNTSAAPTSSGTYTVIVTDAAGCTGTGITNNVTYDNTVPNISEACHGSASFSLYESNGVSWLWTTTSGGRFYPDDSYSVNNDSSVSHLQAPYINFTGSYSVSIVDANGCSSTGTVNVIGTGCSAVLASNIISATATRVSNKVVVQWQVANENAVKEYIVERSADPTTFTAVSTITALNAGSHNYSFTDDVTLLGCTKLYYLVKQISADGTTHASNIMAVNCNLNEVNDYVLNVYPNPVISGNKLTVSYSLPAGIAKAQLIVTNILGGQQHSYVLNNIGNGINTASIIVNGDMTAGAYFVRIISDSWVSKTLKIIKQ